MATSFNLGGLLGVGDGLGDLLTPEQQRAVQQRGLLSAAAALLQAGGQSPTRIGLGQALGSALLAGQTGAEQAQQSALTQMLTRQKVEEARRENAANRAFQLGLERLRPSAMAAPAAPTGEQQLAEFGIPVEPMPIATRQAPGARQLTNAQIDLLGTLPRKEAASELLKMINPPETDKTRQLRELGLEPTLANLQLLDQPEKIRLMQSLGLQPNVANLRLLERPEAAPEKIRTLQSLGLDPTIENLRILDQPGVEPEKIRTLRALNLPLTLENFRALDKPDQTPERIRILERLGIEPTEANLRRFERTPQGQPQRVTELASGRQVLMQQFSDGTYETVGGFGPPRQLERVDLGGRIQFVDMNAVQPGSALAKSLAPQVVGGAESGFFVVGGGGGGAAPRPAAAAPAPARPPAAAGAPVAPAPAAAPAAAAPAPAAAPALPPGLVPLIPGTGPKPTEDQSKSAGFAFRMGQATQTINSPFIDPRTNEPVRDASGKALTLEDIFGKPSRTQAILRAIPSAGATTGIANYFEDQGRQLYRQAQENWVTANLRAESGAVIGEQEMDREIKKYFPQVDDKPETIRQKADARRGAELAMQVRSGPSFANIQRAAAAGTPTPRGRLVRDRNGVTRYVEE